ncbi:blood vessel epicardial substance-like [Centruroides sculpturatus]|uniref:blood vessel epicardial substance-like n=1 Tax=Centruroides sculpturatus TaxID=218467 RepID=UPI000C6CC6A7|nr:blood vessel epicardial substance-like [Centruroides sculpturatus]
MVVNLSKVSNVSASFNNLTINEETIFGQKLNFTLASDLFSDGICRDGWLPTNHILFQLANTFLFLSYLAPTGIHGLLYLRSCLALGCLFFALWGWIILCALDTFVWNFMFTIINLIHIAIILYMLRPIHFSRDIELVYRLLFKPLRVSRHQFKKVLDCMKEILVLKPQDPYCIEKVTRVERLSLVLTGRGIWEKWLALACEYQVFWKGVQYQACEYQVHQHPCVFYGDAKVTVIAMEDCRLLVWHRDKLKLTICGDQFLQAVFDNILGKDVVKKLMLVTEASCNGSAHTEDAAETTKLLGKPKEGRSGMDALISRQFDGRDANVWNLGKIIESEDAETTV